MIAFDIARYIYPPRPTGAVPPGQWQAFADKAWIGQYKFNGSRCLVKCFGKGRYELWNRHKAKLVYTPSPKLHTQLQRLAEYEWTIFDGELIHSKHTAVKHTIALYDLLVYSGEHLLGTPYIDRYKMLHYMCLGDPPAWTHKGLKFGDCISPDIFVPDNWQANEWPLAWSNVEKVNRGYTSPLLEGLVLKNANGKLKPGFKPDNNGDWMTRSRVKTGRHDF